MRYSQVFGKTSKTVPKEAETINHKLLLKGGFIRKISSGHYAYLPFGFRVFHKIDHIIREELAKAGCQDVTMPLIHPASLWQESGRYDTIDEVLWRMKDRHGKDFVLALSHEETVSDLARQEIKSHKDLPMIINQNQLKVRDEARPRGGTLRTREFTMQDAYSFDKDWEESDKSFEKMREAYLRIFKRCGLEMLEIEADSGKMGGTDSREFMVLTDAGEDSVMTCEGCDYKANQEKATFKLEDKNPQEKTKAMKKVAAPRPKTVQGSVDLFKIDPWRVLKNVIYLADGELIGVCIRGDLGVNELKLMNELGANEIRPAKPEELKKVGLVAGFISAIKLKGSAAKIKFYGDHSIETVKNYNTGANELKMDYLDVNYPQDFKVEKLIDVAQAQAGFPCPQCKKGHLKMTRGVEMAHIFKLGTFYSDSMKITYQDEKGKEKPVVMGCYGIGLDRLLAAAVEQHNDEYGIIWPKNIAPYQIHLLSLGQDKAVMDAAEKVYKNLGDAGYEVLFDDRDEPAGVKLNDADLIGAPWRVLVSPKTLAEKSVELKARAEKKTELVGIGGLGKELEKRI